MIDPFWQRCLTHLHGELSQGQFNNWIKPLSVALEDGQILLLAPNSFVLQWVRDRFLKRFEDLAEGYFGQPMRFVLTVRDDLIAPPVPADDHKPNGHNGVHGLNGYMVPRIVNGAEDSNRLNPSFTFNNFVPGKANQLARAAAQQVAEHVGTAYNPLFIYGGVGLGKTHLIQAIGNAALQGMPNAKVQYVTSQDYVTDVVRAYQHKSFDSFKRRYHTLDLLLIDDIQFIGGKSRSQEEFFFAFNALIEAHKQVIITCDRFPKELADVDDRLVSRFGWGLTVAIEPPELEMRVAILIDKAAAENVTLDESIAFFIAKHIRSNVRELEGALKRVFAYVRFTGTPLSLAATKEALKDLLVIQNRQISIENIQKTVADYYKIKVAEMYSKKRNRAIARPRQVAMALAKEFTQLSLPDIGEAFGGRDHTTVLHACRKVEELKDSDGGIHRDLVVLQQILKG
jgi:chromosomal replication initiator protein